MERTRLSTMVHKSLFLLCRHESESVSTSLLLLHQPDSTYMMIPRTRGSQWSSSVEIEARPLSFVEDSSHCLPYCK